MLTVELNRAGLEADSRVLDLGCGGGRHAYACARVGASVVALDLSVDELTTVVNTVAAMAEAGEVDAATVVAPLCADAVRLPFPDATFDLAIASEVLEHVVDDRAAVREIVRVLRHGGRLALSVPRFGPERLNWWLSAEYHGVPGGHLRIYRRSVLVALLESEGLELVGTGHAHGLHSPYWWLRCVVGIGDDQHRLVRAYHRLLVYDIVHRPRLLRFIERGLDPLIGKSLVCYLVRP